LSIVPSSHIHHFALSPSCPSCFYSSLFSPSFRSFFLALFLPADTFSFDQTPSTTSRTNSDVIKHGVALFVTCFRPPLPLSLFHFSRSRRSRSFFLHKMSTAPSLALVGATGTPTPSRTLLLPAQLLISRRSNWRRPPPILPASARERSTLLPSHPHCLAILSQTRHRPLYLWC
jgi:hypothetical protein